MSTTNKTNTVSGYLELIIGPMYAGKTSELLEIYKKCKFCNIPVIIVNHTLDNRYHETMLSSHDKIMIPCIQSTNLQDIWFTNENNNLRDAEVILINEGQFFTDLYKVVADMLNENKKVYICGLDGDFEREKFGQILDLIPLCDNVRKLTSLCSICKDGTHAIFSMRLTEEKEQTVVGSDNYIPVCRKCYTKHTIKNIL
jgi:thymidine kinase